MRGQQRYLNDILDRLWTRGDSVEFRQVFNYFIDFLLCHVIDLFVGYFIGVYKVYVFPHVVLQHCSLTYDHCFMYTKFVRRHPFPPKCNFLFSGLDALLEQCGVERGFDDEHVVFDAGGDAVGEPLFVSDCFHQPAGKPSPQNARRHFEDRVWFDGAPPHDGAAGFVRDVVVRPGGVERCGSLFLEAADVQCFELFQRPWWSGGGNFAGFCDVLQLCDFAERVDVAAGHRRAEEFVLKDVDRMQVQVVLCRDDALCVFFDGLLQFLGVEQRLRQFRRDEMDTFRGTLVVERVPLRRGFGLPDDAVGAHDLLNFVRADVAGASRDHVRQECVDRGGVLAVVFYFEMNGVVFRKVPLLCLFEDDVRGHLCWNVDVFGLVATGGDFSRGGSSGHDAHGGLVRGKVLPHVGPVALVQHVVPVPDVSPVASRHRFVQFRSHPLRGFDLRVPQLFERLFFQDNFGFAVDHLPHGCLRRFWVGRACPDSEEKGVLHPLPRRADVVDGAVLHQVVEDAFVVDVVRQQFEFDGVRVQTLRCFEPDAHDPRLPVFVKPAHAPLHGFDHEVVGTGPPWDLFERGLNERGGVGRDVARHDDGGVAGVVVFFVVLFEAVGVDVFDVRQVPDGRMTVGVFIEGDLHHFVGHGREGVVFSSFVFVSDDGHFTFEFFRFEKRELHAVRLQFQRMSEVLGLEDFVVVCPIQVGGGVEHRPLFLQGPHSVLSKVVFRSAKHHVFQDVGVPGLAQPFVARPDSVGNVEGGDFAFGGHQQELSAVLQGLHVLHVFGFGLHFVRARSIYIVLIFLYLFKYVYIYHVFISCIYIMYFSSKWQIFPLYKTS